MQSNGPHIIRTDAPDGARCDHCDKKLSHYQWEYLIAIGEVRLILCDICVSTLHAGIGLALYRRGWS